MRGLCMSKVRCMETKDGKIGRVLFEDSVYVQLELYNQEYIWEMKKFCKLRFFSKKSGRKLKLQILW